MDERAGIIERAAALLREGKTETAPANRHAEEEPASAVAPAAPLSRSISLDRGHLARIGIIMPWTTTSRVVEEFRIVKRNIMFPWQLPDYPKAADRAPRVVMVTSSRPREGKTFCAINLALAFAAEESLATVLVDTDAVRGDAAKVLGLRTDPGLTDILSGGRTLQDVLVQTDLPNLAFLPSGRHSPHVPELLTGRGPNLLLGELAQRYPEHVIVMDSAPCLASTDPVALAPLASEVVFVVEAEHTQQGEIETSLGLLSGCRKISLLLNKAPVGASEHFGSYSYYHNVAKSAAKAGKG